MSKPETKFWIVNRFVNRINHRSMSVFEKRNPRMFELSHSAHSTWQEAHQALLSHRSKQLAKAIRDAASAERQMSKALTMKDPTS